ncbi:hypothetical protein SMICM304S_03677 [Streptomyces microflavus]
MLSCFPGGTGGTGRTDGWWCGCAARRGAEQRAKPSALPRPWVAAIQVRVGWGSPVASPTAQLRARSMVATRTAAEVEERPGRPVPPLLASQAPGEQADGPHARRQEHGPGQFGPVTDEVADEDEERAQRHAERGEPARAAVGDPADETGDQGGGETGEVEVRHGQGEDAQLEAEQFVAPPLRDQGECGDGRGDQCGEEGDPGGGEVPVADRPACAVQGEHDGAQCVARGQRGGGRATRQP